MSIKLDKLDVQPSSIRDRIVSGEGRLRIGGDEDWIGFRFRTLYDTSLGNASYPDLTLGGISTSEREVPNDSLLVRQLDENVVGLLGKEFGNQAVRLQLDRITTVEAGKRYLRISASGIADFGREGTTPAQVEALYDRRDNAWLRVNYELGSAANWSSRNRHRRRLISHQPAASPSHRLRRHLGIVWRHLPTCRSAPWHARVPPDPCRPNPIC